MRILRSRRTPTGHGCTQDMERCARRGQGFTLLELLIAVAIIGLLLALAVPAVQQMRATARRTECVTRVGQLMLASFDFEQANGFVPTVSVGGASAYWELLPYLDDSPLRESLIQQLKAPSAASTPVRFGDSAFCCPADSLLNVDHGGYSFHHNHGTSYPFSTVSNGYLSPAPGRAERRLREITDGLSQTAAFSERLYDAQDDHRTLGVLRTPQFRILGFTATVIVGANREADHADTCRAARVEPLSSHVAVSRLRLTPDSFSGYDHLLPPNSAGCVNGPESGFNIMERITPATSLHAGGVNLAFADGHTAFQSEAVDVHVWRAIGTISSGD